jgi:hypothetical protein
MEADMADIFFSYSREDIERILPIVHALETTGYTIFWDRNIPTGKSWREVISGELHAAQCVMVAWSDSSIQSRFVIEEAEFSSRQNALVPLLIDKVEPPFGFGTIQAADLSDWDGSHTADAYQKLVRDIGDLIGPPTTQQSDASDGEKQPPKLQETGELEQQRDKTSPIKTPKKRGKVSLGKKIVIFVVLITLIAAIVLVIYSRNQKKRAAVYKVVPERTIVKPKIELERPTIIRK